MPPQRLHRQRLTRMLNFKSEFANKKSSKLPRLATGRVAVTNGYSHKISRLGLPRVSLLSMKF